MRIAIAQIAPVLLDRDATLAKVVAALEESARQGAALVAFGEALLPGYPAWLERTDGARFESESQKEIHAIYLDQAVDLGAGDLQAVQTEAHRHGLAVVLGVVERPRDRGGHSLFCSRIFITAEGDIASVHRKLVPTYEERLTWGYGDGAGLVTHRVGDFTVGALNCWENWMPLARAALQAQGEDLHVMLWPGSDRNTRDITRFAAREGRSYVLSACGLLREENVPRDFPMRNRMFESGKTINNGGSAIAAPDASWILEPVVDREGVFTADLDPAFVRRERQNFDPAGHYARPDVLSLRVNRARQSAARFDGDG